ERVSTFPRHLPRIACRTRVCPRGRSSPRIHQIGHVRRVRQAVPSRPILYLEAQELNALTIRRPFAAVSPRRRFTSPPFHLAAVVPAGVSPAAASPAAA